MCWRHVPRAGHPFLAATACDAKECQRNLRQDSRAPPPCVFNALSGFIHYLLLLVQLLHETALHCVHGSHYSIRFQEPIKSLYNHDQDSFPHWKCAVTPCAVIALITHLLGSGIPKFDLLELLWTFSIYLESIAILPQLLVLRRYRLVENLTGKFVFFLGVYRSLYIVNWIYRAHTESGYRHHWVVYTCGVVQSLLYFDFFYQYLRISRLCRKPKEGEDELISNDPEEEDTRLLFENELSSRRRIDSSSQSAEEPLLVDNSSDSSESP